MKYLTLASLAISATEARGQNGFSFGFCPNVPTWYSQNNQQFNYEDIMGTWYLIKKPGDMAWDENKGGCTTAHLTNRSDAWFYKIGLNFGHMDKETKTVKNGYVLDEPGRDWTWAQGRADSQGNLYAQAMMMPEMPLQVLKTDNGQSYMVVHSCAQMMMEHFSGGMIFSRTKTLPQNTLDELYNMMDTQVPSSEYVARDNLVDVYHGSDCQYTTFSP